MQWELITNVILIASILVLAVFAFLGLYQWISRKSIKKVDRELRYMPLPLGIMVVVYFVFDKLLILNTRPNGSGESSFPSSHVMIVATIFFLVTLILPKYVKSKIVRIILEILMLVAISLTCIGRVLANLHWPADVIGGVAFAFIFSEIYHQILKRKRTKK